VSKRRYRLVLLLRPPLGAVRVGLDLTRLLEIHRADPRIDQRVAANRSPSFFVLSPKMTLSLATMLHSELPIAPT
jgi:hypothetical protein